MSPETRPDYLKNVPKIEIDNDYHLTEDDFNRMRSTPVEHGKGSHLENIGVNVPIPKPLSWFEKRVRALSDLRSRWGESSNTTEQAEITIDVYRTAAENGRPDIQSEMITSIEQRLSRTQRNPALEAIRVKQSNGKID